jgi:RimJ/RimL family protein N-acetyltransferase
VSSSSCILKTSELRLEAGLVPWDTAAFGFPVGQITALEVLSPAIGCHALAGFFEWAAAERIGFASCRLPLARLRESMLLEENGFRFVEVVLHPCIELPVPAEGAPADLAIVEANAADLPELEAIAAGAFEHGRIHIDPRLGAELGARRYSRWVRNTLDHPRQRLLKILDADRIVGMFIVEAMADGSVYWHLTAVAPALQGRGYGLRVWRAMLTRHAEEGMRSVSTTIAAGNIRVLNLYSRLAFRFLPPEMTFHWLGAT